MRDRGQGSVTRHGDRHRARLPAAYDRRSLGVFDTPEEAQSVLDAALAELMADPPEGTTLDAWAIDTLDARAAGDHKRRTVERDRTRWGTYVRGTLLGRTPLIDVSEGDVRRWLASLKKRDGSRLAPTSAQNALSLVRGVLEAAREAGRIPSNPAREVKLSKPARRKTRAQHRWTWMRTEEIDRVIGCAEIPLRSRAAFVTAIYSGLRAGELWGLRWEDVDFDRSVLHVRHSFEDTPKAHAIREVPMLAPVRDWLTTWRELYDASGVRSRIGLVWPSQSELWHSDGYDAGWADRWRERAGIRADVRLHDLRHTCASHLVQGTWAPALIGRALRLEEVRDWLGHEDIGVTQRYAHLCSDAVRSLVVVPETIGTRSGHDGEPLTRVELVTYGLRNREDAAASVDEVPRIGPACPVPCPDLRARIVGALRAIERGDARALVMSADALGGALAAIDEAAAITTPDGRSTDGAA